MSASFWVAQSLLARRSWPASSRLFISLGEGRNGYAQKKPFNMKNKSLEGPLFEWKFSLLDELPGPSEGGAAEFIETLGLNPWSFISLDLVDEATVGDQCLSQFTVRGSQEMLGQLRELHDRATDSCTDHPRPVAMHPASMAGTPASSE